MPAEFPSSGSAGLPAGTVHRGAVLWDGPSARWVNALVGAAEIADGSVGANELAANSVTAGKIPNGAVTAAKLAPGSATNGQVMTLVGGVWAPADPAAVATGPPAAHAASHMPSQTDELDWDGAVHAQGNEVDRPAATAANSGLLYYAVDKRTLWRSNGTSWVLAAWMPRHALDGAGAVSNIERASGADLAAPGSGDMVAVSVPAYRSFPIRAIGFRSGGVTLASGITQLWFAVFAPDGTLLGSTAAQGVTTWAANAWKDLAIGRNASGATVTEVFVPETGAIRIALMVAGTQPPSLRGRNYAQGAAHHPPAATSIVPLIQTVAGAAAATPPANLTGATDSFVEPVCYVRS